MFVRYELPLSTTLNELSHRYPSMVQFQKGNVLVPSATDLVLLQRTMLAFLHLVDHAPEYMNESIRTVVGESYPPYEMDLETSFGKEKVLLSNAIVLTLNEWESLQKTYEGAGQGQAGAVSSA